MALHWKIDECAVYFDRMRLRGWCSDADSTIARVDVVFPSLADAIPLTSYGQPSPDVAAAVNAAATHCRFDEWVMAPADALGRHFRLRVTFADGRSVETDSGVDNAMRGDPFFACWDHFVDHLATLESGTVLEIGSRARSAMTYRRFIPERLGYIGLDILPGPNVDVVGDAHRLGELFGPDRFVAAFSLSVFEHLAMPWQVALELNRVLLPGGMLFTATHQTWPIHEEPWDFWRFSKYSWRALFNAATGFEVVEVACGEPARVHAQRTSPATRSLPDSPAYLGSASLVRKIGATSLTWPVPLETAAREQYPPGELAAPPA